MLKPKKYIKSNTKTQQNYYNFNQDKNMKTQNKEKI